MEILENFSIKNFTSIKIGGKVRYFIKVKKVEELEQVFEFIEKHTSGRFFILGGGTNVIFDDNAIDLTIIKPEFKWWRKARNKLIIGSSITLPRLGIITRDLGLSGLEQLTGIPGELGGAIKMNAGAFGREIGELIRWVKVYKKGTGMLTLSYRELEFDYRHSNIGDDMIIIEAEIELIPSSSARVGEAISYYRAERRARQPIGIKTAGSVFKNPSQAPAGLLIDKVGLKGYRIGNMRFSPKHANFLENLGNGRFKDCIALIEKAKKEVLKRFSVKLEEEVIIIQN